MTLYDDGGVMTRSGGQATMKLLSDVWYVTVGGEPGACDSHYCGC